MRVSHWGNGNRFKSIPWKDFIRLWECWPPPPTAANKRSEKANRTGKYKNQTWHLWPQIRQGFKDSHYEFFPFHLFIHSSIHFSCISIKASKSSVLQLYIRKYWRPNTFQTFFCAQKGKKGQNELENLKLVCSRRHCSRKTTALNRVFFFVTGLNAMSTTPDDESLLTAKK